MIHRRITRNTAKTPAKTDPEEVCGIRIKRQMEERLQTVNQWLTNLVLKINSERLFKEMLKALTVKVPTQEQVQGMKMIEVSLTRAAMRRRGCLFR